MSQIHNQQNRNNDPFPEDFVEEILSRLPVKSLLRFRCVSKSWCSLISSKYFTEFHLKNFPKNSNLASKRIVSILRRPSKRLINYSLESLFGWPVADAVDFEHRIHSSRNSARIVGCCNGIVCIAKNDKQFFLWNPSTRKYKKLADVNDNFDNLEPDRFRTVFGFGFDKSSDDYKIVRILIDAYDDDRFDNLVKIYSMNMVKIYSMSSDSWKGIDAFGDSVSSIYGTGKFVNGKLHWLKCVRPFSGWDELNYVWDIVSFDLGNQTFASVEQPRNGDIGVNPQLGVLEGCLCVFCDFEIWILKQYGVRESWEKLMTVTHFTNDPRPRLDLTSHWIPDGMYTGLTNDLIPDEMCTDPKGEIFWFYKSNLMVYNPKERCSSICFWGAELYIESLISLDDGESDATPETIVGLMR